MDVFRFADLAARLSAPGDLYLEFLRIPPLSAGVYKLPAGATDPQTPHNEDEIYFVVKGRARVQVGDDDEAVEAGSIVFVGARVQHRFHDITEDLELLVLFAPAETS